LTAIVFYLHETMLSKPASYILHTFNFEGYYKGLWERALNAEVTVAMAEEDIEFTGTNSEVLCYYHDRFLNRYYTLVTCKQPIRGRFVQILFNAETPLNIYEVEVHGI